MRKNVQPEEQSYALPPLKTRLIKAIETKNSLYVSQLIEEVELEDRHAIVSLSHFAASFAHFPFLGRNPPFAPGDQSEKPANLANFAVRGLAKRQSAQPRRSKPLVFSSAS